MNKRIGHRLPGVTYWLLFLCVLLPLAADPEPAARQLESLLRELRETRARQGHETEAAAQERRVTERVRAEGERRLKAMSASLAARRQELAVLSQERDRQQQRVAALQTDENLTRQHMQTLAGLVIAQTQQNPRLATAQELAELQKLAAGEVAVEQQAILFWQPLLTLAARGVDIGLDQQLIRVGNDQQLVARVLRLGIIGTLWLTADESRGGVSEIHQSELRWVEVPPAELPAIIHAFRVARGELPAELVRIPLSADQHDTGGTP